MGYTLGMPCLKLNNVGHRSKSCGDFVTVTNEALEERIGKDKDIDKSKTKNNDYIGFRTASELQEYSRKHIEELSEKLKEQGKRKIRNDAVVMVATIIKPPAAYMATLTPEQRRQFLIDANDKLNEIIGESNSKSTVLHFDEQGDHLHKFWEPMTEDGRLCAKEMVSLKFFNKLNKEMPVYLRSKGWDIDDCNCYDVAQKQLESEQEKYQKRKNQGLSSVQYKAQAEAEKNKLLEQVDQLEGKINALEAELEAVKRPVADLRAIEEAREKDKHLLGTVIRSKKADRELIAGAELGATADWQIDRLETSLEKEKETSDQLRNDNERLAEKVQELKKENEDLNRFKRFAIEFLQSVKLFDRFNAWLKDREQQRSQSRFRELEAGVKR